MSNRDICNFFFTQVEPGQHKCNVCGSQRKQAPRTGHTNLISHLASRHPTYRDEYAEFQRRNVSPLEVFGFVDAETSNMFDWLRWVVERNLPLSEVENELTRSVVKMRPTTVETLKVYMRRVAERVGAAIANEMGTEFGLMFDGWTSGSFHFVGVIAIYCVGGERRDRLIGISPLDKGQDADAHIVYLDAILDVYNKSPDMVKFLVGDNCSTNQSVATKWGVPLVGCASHRFNLAVVRFISESDDLVSQIQKLMLQLRLPKNAAKLAEHTHLRAIRSNATRWSSVYQMIDRYIAIRDAIMRVDAVEDLVPRGPAHRRIVTLHSKLSELDSVCVKLQHPRRTLAEVRLLFDACIEMYPDMRHHLDASAAIVHSPQFERAVVRLCSDALLTSADREVLLPFVAATSSKEDEDNEEVDFATAVLRRAKKPRTGPRAVTYSPLTRVIPPTSNDCERLFSECKFVLSDHRSSMLPANFERLMFLKSNRDMWNASTLVA